MLKMAKLGIAMAVLALLIVPAAYAGVPDTFLSYFVPTAGTLASPCEGNTGNCGGIGGGAIRNFRGCPNNDAGQMLPNNARLRVVVKASNGLPIVGVPASDVCILFNGGTAAQGFSGVGDDSIAANFQYNQAANCPDVRCIQADAATDTTGTTFITLIGSTPGTPGVGTRDALRKWGNWAGNVPVMVLGFQLQGKLTNGSALGSYTCHIRSLDTAGNTSLLNNVAEVVNSADVNPVQAATLPSGSNPDNATNYKFDFDNSGAVNSADLNLIKGHILPQGGQHRCNLPLNP